MTDLNLDGTPLQDPPEWAGITPEQLAAGRAAVLAERAAAEALPPMLPLDERLANVEASVEQLDSIIVAVLS